MSDDVKRLMLAALKKMDENGGNHLHHSDCIHNLSPEDQIKVRGKTVEWWMKWVGTMPQQITPDQWETTPLDLGEHSSNPREDG